MQWFYETVIALLLFSVLLFCTAIISSKYDIETEILEESSVRKILPWATALKRSMIGRSFNGTRPTLTLLTDLFNSNIYSSQHFTNLIKGKEVKGLIPLTTKVWYLSIQHRWSNHSTFIDFILQRDYLCLDVEEASNQLWHNHHSPFRSSLHNKIKQFKTDGLDHWKVAKRLDEKNIWISRGNVFCLLLPTQC